MSTTWLKCIAKRALDAAKERGFTEPSWEDNFPAKLLWAASELVEAEEGEWGEELADVAMRVSAVLVAIWGDDWSDRTEGGAVHRNVPDPHQTRASLLWPILAHITKAGESWRKDAKRDAEQHLGLALLETWRLAAGLGLDLRREINLKLEKNSHRGYLHGKVRKEG